MSESAQIAASEAPAGTSGGVRVAVPTLLFVLYLTHTAAAAILAVVALRLYSLTAGFTGAATCPTLGVMAVAGALGAAFAANRCRRSHQPMALLAVAEIGFGLAALLSVGAFAAARALVMILWPTVGHAAPGGFVLNLVLAAGLFALPAAFTCATLPIVARMITSRPQAAGLGLGFAFGLALAGAALGVAMSGSLVLPSLGLRGGLYMGLALTGISAAGLVLLRQRGLEGAGCVGAALSGDVLSGDVELEPHPTTIRAGVLGSAMALFAFTTWGLLLVWDRALSFVVGRTLPARTTTAAVFILGLAVGVFVSAALADRLRHPFAALAALLTAAAVAACASMYGMPQVAMLYLRLTPYLDDPGLSQLPATLAAAALMLPSVLFLGAALPLLGQSGRMLRRPAAGIAVFFALGILLADGTVGLLGIPAFGLRRALSLVAAVGLLAAAQFVMFAVFRNPSTRTTLALVLLALMVLLGLFPASWDPRVVASGLYRYGARSLQRFGSISEYMAARRALDVLFYREGRESSVMVEHGLQPTPGLPPVEMLTLTVDGRVEATTGDDIRTQVLQGHIPILVHGPTANVLQIDYLDGVTAGSILRHPVKSLTVVEREPALFEASSTFASYNNSPTGDTRLERVTGDARARLLADATRYDVILLAGIEPWLPHSAALLTREGLALIRQRLNVGGIAALRLPLAAAGEDELRVLMRTFRAAFPAVLVFQISGEDLLLLGSADPLTLDAGWIRNIIQSNGDVARDLRRITVIGPNEILYTFRLDGDALAALAGPGAVSRDDRPEVEFATARDMTVHTHPDLLAAVEKGRTSIFPILKNYGATPAEKSDFLYNLAKSYLGIAGDAVLAKSVAAELQALGQTARARWVNGEALMQQADVDGAIGEWRGVLDIVPDDLDALFSLGTTYLDNRDYWKAQPYLEQAARKYPSVAVVRYNHGRNLFYLGRNREAIAELKEARRLGMEQERHDIYPVVDYLVGIAAHRMKDDPAAASSLETYLKWAYTQPLTRVEVDAHLKLAEAYDVLGRRFDAQKQRQKGNELLRRLQVEETGRSGGGTATAPRPGPAPAGAPVPSAPQAPPAPRAPSR